MFIFPLEVKNKPHEEVASTGTWHGHEQLLCYSVTSVVIFWVASDNYVTFEKWVSHSLSSIPSDIMLGKGFQVTRYNSC